MIDQAPLWADPRLTYSVAAVAVVLLLAAIWLFGRKKRQGRQAGVICLSLSIVLHLGLIILVPMLPVFRGQAQTPSDSITTTDESLSSFQFFDPDAESPSATQEIQPAMNPLPISSLSDQLDSRSEQVTSAEDALARDDDTPLDVDPNPETNLDQPTSKTEKNKSSEVVAIAIESLIPQALTVAAMTTAPDSAPIDSGASLASSMNSQLDSLLESALAANTSPTPPIPQSAVAAQTPPVTAIPQRAAIPTPSLLASSKSSALVASNQPTQNDFAIAAAMRK